MPCVYQESPVFDNRAITVVSVAGPCDTVIDGSASLESTVRFINGDSSVLGGFTITGGSGSAVGVASQGGGILSLESSPTVRNCVITVNHADRGAGIATIASTARFEGLIICSNSAEDSGGGFFTGIHEGTPDTSVVCNTWIIANHVLAMGSGAHSGGGGVAGNQGKATFEFVTVWGNATNETVRGAISADTQTKKDRHHPRFRNSIFWNNGPAPVYFNFPDAEKFTFCDVEFGTNEPWFGSGCIEMDPALVAPGGCPEPCCDDSCGDYHLRAVSPCIDAGDPAYTHCCSGIDFDGDARPQDGDLDGDSIVDMGADEFSGCPNVTDASWISYCEGWPGTNGIPDFTASEDPVICTTIALDIQNSLAFPTQGFLLVGLVQACDDTALDGKLSVVPLTIMFLSLPPSGLSLPAPIPCDCNFSGLCVYLQVLELDPGASSGVSFTPGVKLTFGL